MEIFTFRQKYVKLSTVESNFMKDVLFNDYITYSDLTFSSFFSGLLIKVKDSSAGATFSNFFL